MTGKQLAILAEGYLAGDVGFWEFMNQAPAKPKNSDALDLIDLIEHQPRLTDKQGNLTAFGSKYIADIRDLIERLKYVTEAVAER